MGTSNYTWQTLLKYIKKLKKKVKNFCFIINIYILLVVVLFYYYYFYTILQKRGMELKSGTVGPLMAFCGLFFLFSFFFLIEAFWG